ncbi:hypothetical protein BDF22DRAFT_742563 [Syncephalis plumigaleata]|nr:hypothetical protein BDF22DRAFT_742563 [Syncephalis plumigaleata]
MIRSRPLYPWIWLKTANKSAKKQTVENARILRNVQWGLLIVNSIYVLVQFGWYRADVTRYSASGYLITWLPTIFIYRLMAKMARPQRDMSGAIVSGGDDLNAPGLTSYMFDILYVTWFVHLGSLLWSFIWWFYLVIPLYAGYAIWGFVAPMLKSNGGGQEEMKSKRQQKMEKRQQRGNVRYTQTH